MIFGKWLITTNHMTYKSNRTVNPNQALTSVVRDQSKKDWDVFHYSTTGYFCETARAFNLNKYKVQGIIKTRPVARKMILSKKQNIPSAGRPLSYPVKLKTQLIKWILVLLDLNFPVSILVLQEKANNLIQPCNPEFKASRGWIEKIFNCHKHSLWSRTSVYQ